MSESNSPSGGNIAGQFGQALTATPVQDYGHAQADKVRAELEAALGESATGARLLKMAAQQKIAIHVIKNKQASGFLPDNRAVYIGLPADLSTGGPEAVLNLGAYLRQAELHLLGIKNPGISIASKEEAVNLSAKLIDMLTVMCKITSELYDKGRTEFVDSLIHMGHGELYKAFKEFGPGDQLVEVFYKVYKREK